LEQAVFFGDRPEVGPCDIRCRYLLTKQNPLAFSIDANVEGDLGEAMQQISDEIVASGEPIHRLHTCRLQLTLFRITLHASSVRVEVAIG
jgi:hypothetical protein